MAIRILPENLPNVDWVTDNNAYPHYDDTYFEQRRDQWNNLVSYLRGNLTKEDLNIAPFIHVSLPDIQRDILPNNVVLRIFNDNQFGWATQSPNNLANAIEAYLGTVDDNGNLINHVDTDDDVDVADEDDDTDEDEDIANEDDDTDEDGVSSTLPRNLILQGAPGTGKTHLARQLAHWLIAGEGKDHIQNIDTAIGMVTSLTTDKITVNEKLKDSSQFRMVQFHPATSYEDFVRGIRAKTEDKSVTYEVEHGHLSKMCKEAAGNPTKNYVLLIDEINRANLPAVLGECIFALEYRGQAVDTAYEKDGNRKLTIPENLWIIGTMNTADRSVGHLDYAIRRRFLFVDCLGDERKVDEAARATFNKINKIIKEYRSEEFEEKDIQIGHTYFMEADWETRLKYQVKPILEEYLRDGVLKPSAKEAVAGL